MEKLFKTGSILAVCFIGLLSVACDHTTYKNETDAYTENCEEHGGLAHIDNMNRVGHCYDGEYFPPYVKKDT